jgi:hypothetical protein
MYFELYKDVNGQWRWRLKSANRQIIAISGEGYYNKSDCQHAISLVKGCSTALIYEV